MDKNIIDELNKKKGYILFVSAYILYILYKVIYNSTFREMLSPNVIKYIKFASWAIFLLKVILDTKKDIKTINSSLILLSCIIRINSGSSEIFELVLIILATKNIEFKQIVKITLREIEIICGVIIFSSLIGFIQNYEFIRASGEYKQAFGFIYVSKLPMYFLHILFLKLYLYESEKRVAKNWVLILFFILSTFL